MNCELLFSKQESELGCWASFLNGSHCWEVRRMSCFYVSCCCTRLLVRIFPTGDFFLGFNDQEDDEDKKREERVEERCLWQNPRWCDSERGPVMWS